MGSGYSLAALAQWQLAGNAHYGKAGFKRAAQSPSWNQLDVSRNLASENHVVVGSNAGLGLATALALARRGASVYMACRDKQRGDAAVARVREETGNPNVYLALLDATDARSIRSFASEWTSSARPLHSLINNAGVLLPQRQQASSSGLEAGWATAMGQTYLLTASLLPALQRASPCGRVVNVSSGGQYLVHLDLKDPQASGNPRVYDGAQQYAHAKRAQTELTKSWAALSPGQLAEIGAAAAGVPAGAAQQGLTEAPEGGGDGGVSHHHPVLFASMHPGWSDTPGVQTSLPDFHAKQQASLRSAEEGADTIVWLATAPLAALQRQAQRGSSRASAASGSSSPSSSSEPAEEAVRGVSGLFWFDRAVAPTDFRFAGTALSAAERTSLWTLCERTFPPQQR